MKIKRFFKAILMGLWTSETLRYLAQLYAVVGWLPLLSMIIIRVFGVNLTLNEEIGVVFVGMLWGVVIWAFVSHCLEAQKYAEENKCDFTEAWKATDTSCDDY